MGRLHRSYTRSNIKAKVVRAQTLPDPWEGDNACVVVILYHQLTCLFVCPKSYKKNSDFLCLTLIRNKKHSEYQTNSMDNTIFGGMRVFNLNQYGIETVNKSLKYN